KLAAAPASPTTDAAVPLAPAGPTKPPGNEERAFRTRDRESLLDYLTNELDEDVLETVLKRKSNFNEQAEAERVTRVVEAKLGITPGDGRETTLVANKDPSTGADHVVLGHQEQLVLQQHQVSPSTSRDVEQISIGRGVDTAVTASTTASSSSASLYQRA
ncbi:unnamed protein product, partial [Amoebophrya sp. A25]